MSPPMRKRTSKRGAPLDMETRRGELEALFERGAFTEALARAEALVTETQEHPEALHWRAAALTELGRVDEALEDYARALEEAPDDVDLLLAAADCLITRAGDDREAVEDGLALCARGRKLAQRAGDTEVLFELLLLEGIGFNQVGECARALTSLDAALAEVPGALEALLERAIALFELCRFSEAQSAFEDILADTEDEPWAHHYLGLLAERRSDMKEARRRFERAQALSPEDFPPPVELGEKAFDQAVEAAVKALPAHVKKYMDNVTLAVEDLPKDDDLMGDTPPLSPCILGVFRGSPVGERHSILGTFDPYPASIVLYQKNLERFAKTREELIEQIGITVMHEVGHLMGLDEDDLWQRGLD